MRDPWKLTSFVFAAALAIVVSQSSITPASAQADGQPRMHEALGNLRGAARALDAAAHDKGGHREGALELTRAAIAQVEQGLRYADSH